MKILIKITEDPARYFLVALGDHRMQDEVATWVRRKRYGKAIVKAFAHSTALEELSPGAACGIDADMILTEQSAHWDLL